MTDQRITALQEALPRMSDQDRAFGECLLGHLELQNSLTEREWFWMGELARRYPPPVAVQLEGNLGPMVAMLVMAQTKLLEPKVRLIAQYDEGKQDFDNILLSMNSREGYVLVEAPGIRAKITGDGVLVSRQVLPNYIIKALNEFSKDPIQSATAYGRRTGRCCFCYTKLEDERSVRVGYGPVCAKNYGLPFPTERTVEGMLAQLERK